MHNLDGLFGSWIIAVMILSVAGSSQGNIILVLPGDNIQAAIDSAQPEDTIKVQDGVYREKISLDKPLTLQGIGSPVIDGINNENAIALGADGISISGLRIINASTGILVKSCNNSIINNTIEDCRTGIALLDAPRNSINKNNILANGMSAVGIRLVSSDDNLIIANKKTGSLFGKGIYIRSSRNNTIKENTVSGGTWWGDGIYLESCKNSTIEKNSATGYGLWGDGIYIKSCENCTTKGNNAIGIGTYGRGIHLTSSHHNIIEGNTIDGKIVMKKGWGTSGISLESSEYNNISFNRAMDNGGSGIYLDRSWHNSILGNAAYNNHPGAFLRASRHNNIKDNIFKDREGEASMIVMGSIKCVIMNNHADIDLVDSDDCTVEGNAGWIKHSTIPDP